jgi:hypothetical protein
MSTFVLSGRLQTLINSFEIIVAIVGLKAITLILCGHDLNPD